METAQGTVSGAVVAGFCVQGAVRIGVAAIRSRKNLRDHHFDAVEKALGPVKQMLDGFSNLEGREVAHGMAV